MAKAGAWVVKSLSNISRILKWKEFIVASLIMSFASTLAELLVGINAGIKKVPQLSVGNVIGSNVLVLTLVIGIGAILAGKLKFKTEIIKRSSVFAIGYLFLPVVFLLDGYLSRIDGILLVLAMVFYFYELCVNQSRYSKIYNHYHHKTSSKKITSFIKYFFILIGGVAILLIGSQGVVFSAMHIASVSAISLFAIGIIGIAIGTSLPEIVFAVESTRLGYKEMILGDALGAVVVNSGLVLGVTAIICPFILTGISQYIVGIIFSILAAGLFFVFSRTKDEINKKEAIILIGIYALFLIVQIFQEVL